MANIYIIHSCPSCRAATKDYYYFLVLEYLCILTIYTAHQFTLF